MAVVARRSIARRSIAGRQWRCRKHYDGRQRSILPMGIGAGSPGAGPSSSSSPSSAPLPTSSSLQVEEQSPKTGNTGSGAGPIELELGSRASDGEVVPQEHLGLHSALYGAGGAETEHGSAKASGGDVYVPVKGEDDGTADISVEEWCTKRAQFKLVGVFAVFDDEHRLQHIGYSRNVHLSLRTFQRQLGAKRVAWVRVKVFDRKMVTRTVLEEERKAWLTSFGVAEDWEAEGGGGFGVDAGKAGKEIGVMTAEEKAEYEEKKYKLRKAMGESSSILEADMAEESGEELVDNLRKAVEEDDWSGVIDQQTSESLNPKYNKVDKVVAANEREEEKPIVSPFSGGGALVPAETGEIADEMTIETVDSALDDVRPYLIADGGNVEVVAVHDGYVSLRLQGACGTCPSSTVTLKMGIERSLKEKFGDRLKGVGQVDAQDTSASLGAVDAHIESLRPAIANYGGNVKILRVEARTCEVAYKGPEPILMGIKAAIKDKFPDIDHIDIVPFEEA